MRKMEMTVLEAVRFGNEDVIAASGRGIYISGIGNNVANDVVWYKAIVDSNGVNKTIGSALSFENNREAVNFLKDWTGKGSGTYRLVNGSNTPGVGVFVNNGGGDTSTLYSSYNNSYYIYSHSNGNVHYLLKQ